MPTYEYECTACHHHFERSQPMTARRASTSCPRCKRSAKRLISAGAGFLFKGSGFYATDYRSSGYRNKAKAESSGSSPCPSDKSPCKPECATKQPA